MRLLPFLTFSLVAPLAAQSGWSAPTLLTALNTTAADTGGHISLDGLTAHWSSFVSGNWEFYSSTRPTRTSAWGAPVLETALSDPSAVDNEPFLCADGLTIYFASQRTGGPGSFDILRATRPTTGSPWGTPTFVSELNSTAADSAPALTEDELELYFLTTGWGAPFAPQNAIFVAKRTSTAMPFGTPTLVSELSTPNTHRDVHITPDGLQILYSELDPGTRRVRIYRATRTNRASPFGAAAPITELDGVGSGVYSVSITRDGLEMMLGGPQSVGSQELLESHFDGLTSEGAPTLASPARLYVRDSANPGRVYALALALGNTGFALGSRTVPIDADPLFLTTFGTSLPPITTGFLGVLSGQGTGTATVATPFPGLSGLHVFACAFTLLPSAPMGVQTISNAVELEFQ